MTKKIQTVLLVIICLFSALIITASAENEPFDYPAEELTCISYRGDTTVYEPNSPQAVKSAFDKGADIVSVNIRKSSDGTLLLCSENATAVKGIALSEMLSTLGSQEKLILDFDISLKDEVYELVKADNALGKVYLRIKDSAESINSWLGSKTQAPMVIGVCSSFNIFTVMSFVKKLSHLPAIQLQSKNYFNVMYGSWCYSLYDSRVGTRVIAPMYEPDLCGQRSDSEDGWNDLIKKNFSAIETNNIESLRAYKNNAGALKENLIAVLRKAEAIDAGVYSLVSRENLSVGIETAKTLIDGGIASCDELESAASILQRAMNNLTLSKGEDTQKGALNITAGKVIAAVVVGMAILAAQIYTYKMQKVRKRTGEK